MINVKKIGGRQTKSLISAKQEWATNVAKPLERLVMHNRFGDEAVVLAPSLDKLASAAGRLYAVGYR